MPPKPTCKAVLKAGQRGVRVYPKGCKVRTTVAADGTKKQVNKKGKTKRKVKVTAESFYIGLYNSNHTKGPVSMVYDTGAVTTSLTPADLRVLGYNPDRTTGIKYMEFIDANNNVTKNKVLKGCRLSVKIASNDFVSISVDIVVAPTNLLGMSAIKQLKRLKVKFK